MTSLFLRCQTCGAQVPAKEFCVTCGYKPSQLRVIKLLGRSMVIFLLASILVAPLLVVLSYVREGQKEGARIRSAEAQLGADLTAFMDQISHSAVPNKLITQLDSHEKLVSSLAGDKAIEARHPRVLPEYYKFQALVTSGRDLYKAVRSDLQEPTYTPAAFELLKSNGNLPEHAASVADGYLKLISTLHRKLDQRSSADARFNSLNFGVQQLRAAEQGLITAAITARDAKEPTFDQLQGISNTASDFDRIASSNVDPDIQRIARLGSSWSNICRAFYDNWGRINTYLRTTNPPDMKYVRETRAQFDKPLQSAADSFRGELKSEQEKVKALSKAAGPDPRGELITPDSAAQFGD